jgi:hypothetical protein
MGHRIVVEGSHVRPGGGANPLVDGGAEAGVAGILNDARTWSGAVAAYQTLAAVIDNHHFEI